MRSSASPPRRRWPRQHAPTSGCAAGDAGPLTGVPIAHKDIFCTRGEKTSCGSRMLANFVSPYDATVVERLRAAGVVMLGKTNMDEFAMGSSNETSFFGPVRNPWDTRRVPGGSSGGSAAAVAARLAPAATATDTGGSIRQPAALCGVTGLKPTYGRVSRYGMIAFASSLDQGGVITRSAEDAALLLAAMAGFDERDSTSVEMPVPDYSAALEQPLKGLKIGVLKEFFDKGLDAEIEQHIRAALELLRSQGAVIKDVSLPHLPLSVPTYYVVAPAECSSNLARFDGVRYGHRCENPRDLLDLYQRSRGEGFGAEVKRRIMTGTYVLSAGYYDAYYLKAQRVRQLISNDFEHAFHEVDVHDRPDHADRGVRARRQDQRSGDDVPERHLHDRRESCGPAGDLGAMRPDAGAAGRPADHRSAFWRGAAAERRASLPARDRLASARAAGVRLMEWETVIGLEIHAQLSTRSKIFSGSATAYGAAPNAQADLIDLAYPGVLPVLNAEAVRMAVKFGLAINARVMRRSIFARKNYFYPDLPKGYQISQYELPIVCGGAVDIVLDDGSIKRIGITRAHLEEDAGKSLHEGLAGLTGVDLNRAGTPLIEIVSEPAHALGQGGGRLSEEDPYAGALPRDLRRQHAGGLVPLRRQRLGAPARRRKVRHPRRDQEPQLIPLRREGDQLRSGAPDRAARGRRPGGAGDAAVRRGPRRDALDALQGRGQRLSLFPGSRPAAAGDRSALHRHRGRKPAGAAGSEGAALRQGLWPVGLRCRGAHRQRRAGRLLRDRDTRAARPSRRSVSPKLVANTVMGELAGLLNRDGLEITASRVNAPALAGLLRRIADNTISGKIAKEVLEAMWSEGREADAIIEARGLRQITDESAIEAAIDAVIAANPTQLAQYRSGKDKLFGFFVGQAMKATQGKANPARLNELLKKKLGG